MAHLSITLTLRTASHAENPLEKVYQGDKEGVWKCWQTGIPSHLDPRVLGIVETLMSPAFYVRSKAGDPCGLLVGPAALPCAVTTVSPVPDPGGWEPGGEGAGRDSEWVSTEPSPVMQHITCYHLLAYPPLHEICPSVEGRPPSWPLLCSKGLVDGVFSMSRHLHTAAQNQCDLAG